MCVCVCVCVCVWGGGGGGWGVGGGCVGEESKSHAGSRCMGRSHHVVEGAVMDSNRVFHVVH